MLRPNDARREAVLPYAAERAPSRETPTPDRLRVLMVAARYLPWCGGTETHVAEVSRRLAAAGHHVGILTADPTGALPAQEVVDGVQILRVKAWPKGRDYYFAPSLYGAISAERWDLVHIQGYHTLFAPLAMMAAIAKRIPFVITFHSGGHSSPVRSRLRPLQMSLLKPLVQHASRCIGVSRFEADTFAEGMSIDRGRFTVINNGAELPRPRELRPPNTCEPLIISIGRLEKYKGHHRAMEAFQRLRSEIPDARLVILGGGPYEAALRELAENMNLTDCVRIGSIPGGDRQDLADLLARARLVVLLSDYEANPVGVMEALSLGRPVLTTDCSGFSELHEQGLISVVPLDATPDAIATAMGAEMMRPDKTVQYTLPDWQGCTDRLLEVYESVRSECREASGG